MYVCIYIYIYVCIYIYIIKYRIKEQNNSSRACESRRTTPKRQRISRRKIQQTRRREGTNPPGLRERTTLPTQGHRTKKRALQSDQMQLPEHERVQEQPEHPGLRPE